jgi:allantoin racemase
VIVKIKVIVPFPFDRAGIDRRASGIGDCGLRPDTEVTFVAVKNSARSVDSLYDTFLLDMFIFEEGLKSEQEGYDAVCIDTVSDSAVIPLRSRLSIPVVGPGQVSHHVAAMLGKRFSVITLSDAWVDLNREFVARTGMLDRLASVRSIGKVPDLYNLLDGNAATFKAIKAAALLALQEDGADVIVLGSTTMHEAYAYLKAELPCPVVNPGVWSIRFAEMLVQMKLNHSKVAFRSPSCPIDDLIFSSLERR